MGEADFLGRALPERPPPSSVPDWFFNLPPRGSLWSSCPFPFPILHLERVSRWLYLSKMSSKRGGEVTSIRTLIFNILLPPPPEFTFRPACTPSTGSSPPVLLTLPLCVCPSNVLLAQAQGYCQWTDWWAGPTLQLPLSPSDPWGWGHRSFRGRNRVGEPSMCVGSRGRIRANISVAGTWVQGHPGAQVRAGEGFRKSCRAVLPSAHPGAPLRAGVGMREGSRWGLWTPPHLAGVHLTHRAGHRAGSTAIQQVGQSPAFPPATETGCAPRKTRDMEAETSGVRRKAV